MLNMTLRAKRLNHVCAPIHCNLWNCGLHYMDHIPASAAQQQASTQSAPWFSKHCWQLEHFQFLDQDKGLYRFVEPQRANSK
jgi:hypothetical protein